MRCQKVLGLAIVLLVATSRGAWANPAPQLVGTWQAQVSGNAFVIKIGWSAAAGRYEGVLVQQGVLSARAGFSLGELCWTAKLSPNPNLLEILEERRGPARNGSAAVEWVRAGVYLNAISATTMKTSLETFRRVDTPASPAVIPGAPLTPGLTPPVVVLPSPADVLRAVRSSDEIDTLARQTAAFVELGAIVSLLQQDAAPKDRSAQFPLYYQLQRDYWIGHLQAERQLRTVAGRSYVNPYLGNPAFVAELDSKVLPQIGRVRAEHRQAAEDAARAKAAAAEAAREANAQRQAAAAEKLREDREKRAVEQAAEDARAREEEKAAEAARQVEVNLTGTWSGVTTIAPGLFDCRSAGLHPGLFRISRQGRTVRAVTVESNDCVPAKSVLWEGQLPKDKLIVGDLPLSIEVQVFAATKGGKRKALPYGLTLKFVRADLLSIVELDFPFKPGDQRKDMAGVLADVLARRQSRPRRGGASAPAFDVEAYMRDGKARMQRDIDFYDRQDRTQQWDDYQRRQGDWNNGSCSDCGGAAPSAPNVEQPE